MAKSPARSTSKNKATASPKGDARAKPSKAVAAKAAPENRSAQTTVPSPVFGAGGRADLVDTAAGVGVLSPRTGDLPGQDSEFLTSAQGVRIPHTDDSLKAGRRGPVLMDDFHLRERIMHFDHERIPERVVHARGVGVHGEFTSYGTAGDLTSAGFLASDVTTPVFVRFSTVVGSRGSADTARDVRGFATKFYTAEGVFDLVGNNIPVFFIRDAIKFPDLVHAAKPEADLEVPQASTAHSTFWDFVSSIPESPHMLMWVMSDRAIPRSLRMMEGFGVHTFRLVNEARETVLVKFHWKPTLGVHGLEWEEAQLLAGLNPDFHRRDLYQAIAAGIFPQWELGVQVFPDTEDQTFEGIDLLDSTKLVPEELAPVRPIGLMTLNRNPTNFFSETEQVAFHVGHFVAGIEATDDPLMHGRLFSYLDTQLTRLGGPNFDQIPINRPQSPVNDNHRDGFMQMRVPHGRTPYLPNAVGGGCPFLADASSGGYEHIPRPVMGPKTRERAETDNFSQATMFYRSLTPLERQHVVNAFSFELSHVDAPIVVQRMLAMLANVDTELCELVATALGEQAPVGTPNDDVEPSAALSMIRDEVYPVDGRVVQILATDGSDLDGITALCDAITAAGGFAHVVAPRKGVLRSDGGVLAVNRTLMSASSTDADAVLLASGSAALAQPGVRAYLEIAFRHGKSVGAWGDSCETLRGWNLDDDDTGVFLTDSAVDLADPLIEAMGGHRHWSRFNANLLVTQN